MKRICLFVNLLLIATAAIHAQQAKPLDPNKQKIIDSLKSTTIKLLPENHYSKNLSFFCKKELQLEKLTKVSLKIRIGSLDDVDRLEGKKKN